jgi:hypothetical protein
VGRLRTLLDNGGDAAHAEHWLSRTPLHVAAEANATRCLVVLIERGADVNARAAHGTTPLHMCCVDDAAECAGLLLRTGALPHLRDDRGRDAAELAGTYKAKRVSRALKTCRPPKKQVRTTGTTTALIQRRALAPGFSTDEAHYSRGDAAFKAHCNGAPIAPTRHLTATYHRADDDDDNDHFFELSRTKGATVSLCGSTRPRNSSSSSSSAHCRGYYC